MNPRRALIARRVLAVLAAAFGVATLFAGLRVLGGADPGYVVYRPLLVFNTAMGAAYLAAALALWLDARRGRDAAVAIAVLNLAALVWIGTLAAASAAVATASVGAMSLRAGFWVVVALVVARQLGRR